MGIRLVYGLKTRDESWLGEFYPSRRLAEAMAAYNLEREPDARVDYRAVLFPPDASVDETIAACAGHVALLRGELPLALYAALEAAGTRVVNGSGPTALARDKLASAEFFRRNGFAHPRTVGFAAGEGAPPPLPFPFVAKPRYGKMGRGVSLIRGAADWPLWNAANPGDGIAQDYVEASAGRDVRFFFAGWLGCGVAGVAGAVCVSRRGDGFLSNAHAGARMHPFDPPPRLAAEAARAFALSGLDYGTVDFLFANREGSEFAVCELNSCPGFEELERATGLDAARAIVETAAAIARKEP